MWEALSERRPARVGTAARLKAQRFRANNSFVSSDPSGAESLFRPLNNRRDFGPRQAARHESGDSKPPHSKRSPEKCPISTLRQDAAATLSVSQLLHIESSTT